MPFRIESAQLFVDESGQFRTPGLGEPPEFGTVAGFLIPNTERDRKALATLVAELRRDLFGDAPCQNRIKGGLLRAEHFARIANDIRDRWVMGYYTLEITTDAPSKMRTMLESTILDLESAAMRLSPNRRLDLRLEFLKNQIRWAAEKHPIYMALLHQLYQGTARWFRKNGILPHMRVWLDHKLLPKQRDLHHFFGAFSIWTHFPEVYGDRLAELLGVVPCSDFACQISSDDREDGLIIADAIVHAARKVARGADNNGVCRKFLELATFAPDP